MTHSKILLVALQEELPTPPDGYKIVYTGVGKLNAMYNTMQAIAESHSYGEYYPEIYNYGTVGSCNKELSGMHRVTRFIQRDMNAEPQAPRGTTPFDNSVPYLDFNHDTLHGLTLGTGDQFVHELDPWLVDNTVDIVDMEAYSIAHICQKMKLSFTCYKYVTDYVGTPRQSDVWQSNVSNGVEDILRVLEI